jgi:hypothetical protein
MNATTIIPTIEKGTMQYKEYVRVRRQLVPNLDFARATIKGGSALGFAQLCTMLLKDFTAIYFSDISEDDKTLLYQEVYMNADPKNHYGVDTFIYKELFEKFMMEVQK